METQHTSEIGTGPVWLRDSSAFSMQLFAANPYAVYLCVPVGIMLECRYEWANCNTLHKDKVI